MSEEHAEELEEEPEPENECDLCGDDHELHECDQGWCGKCRELLDNCDCEAPDERAPEEWKP